MIDDAAIRLRYEAAGPVLDERGRLWKVELQALADELGLEITVRHLPPGTSKWNKIEHRLFSFITQNWREGGMPTEATVAHVVVAKYADLPLHRQAQIYAHPGIDLDR